MSLVRLLHDVLGDDFPVAVRTWDGARIGSADASATIVVRSRQAVARLVQAPGQLGLARAYVAGELDVEGDIFAALAAGEALGAVRPSVAQWANLARVAGRGGLRRLPAPAEEAHLHGRRHGRARDRAAISYHYDVSNDFYQAILGPSMTYSCALFADPEVSLEVAQMAKHELVCRKLGLEPGQRLLDVGCGWGTMVRHAAGRHDVEAVGVTLSAAQAEWAAKAVVEDDLTDLVAVRLQDYRDVADGPFDAISSVGMSEHVGAAQLPAYFKHLFGLLAPAAGSSTTRSAASRPAGPPLSLPVSVFRRMHMSNTSGTDPVTSLTGVHIGSGSDPRTLGLMAFALGTLAVGMSTVGQFPAASAGGGIIPIALFAAGIALALASFWAFILGSSYFAGTFGIVAGFFFSFAILLLGLIHNWFAVPATNVDSVLEIFYIVWCCFFLALIIPSLRLPALYPLVAALLATYLALSATTTYEGAGGNISIAAGSSILAASFLLFWGYVASSLRALRAKVHLQEGPILMPSSDGQPSPLGRSDSGGPAGGDAWSEVPTTPDT